MSLSYFDIRLLQKEFGEIVFFLRLFFKGSLRFTTKLRGRYREFPIYPLPLHMHCFPHFIITHQSGACITKNEPTLTHHNHSKSMVCLRVHSCFSLFNEFRWTGEMVLFFNFPFVCCYCIEIQLIYVYWCCILQLW